MKKIFTLLMMAALTFNVFADEGMWIPLLLGRNEADMQKAGMRITAKDIYDINNACLKDAVILFGSGCTGEFVSHDGLILTNHHCGYYYITKHSTVDHDYLTNGFWAMSRDEEIPCPGLTATRLVRMEDVTEQVLAGISSTTSEAEREAIIMSNSRRLCLQAEEGSHYKATIKPFYYGNQYFLYINEIFSDVRMVGAPPSNIGKFGGDTDNWMWPRHTGDFSIFRVYANEDNKPARYSSNNRPYHPLKSLEISLDGVNEGDFTFVFGYPGTTRRYLTSDAVQLAVQVENPVRIDLRTIRLKHYNKAMNQSPAQRLKYAARVANIANGWKKWQGETQGISRLDGINKKKEYERRFQKWANNKPEYKKVLAQLKECYDYIRPINLERAYYTEAFMASDFMNRAQRYYQLTLVTDEYAVDTLVKKQLLPECENYFSDFQQHRAVDSAIFVETLLYMWRAEHTPASLGDTTSHDTTWVKHELAKIYSQSIINNEEKLKDLLADYTPKKSKKLMKDPAIKLFGEGYESVTDKQKAESYKRHNKEIERLMRIYVKGMMDMDRSTLFFPDANLTLRVAYGHVQGFHPRDGVYYRPYSTLNGIMEKENPDIYDYVVEPKLKKLYANKDFGRYGIEAVTIDSTVTDSADATYITYVKQRTKDMPVCFIATNHTTGGNSGSPVLNADGRLIGINFDRCWEGTMSDLLFDPDYCRNICLDIRYCLFIIDKFAGAKHLVDEMTLVKSEPQN